MVEAEPNRLTRGVESLVFAKGGVLRNLAAILLILVVVMIVVHLATRKKKQQTQ